jgi:hypothetical protein
MGGYGRRMAYLTVVFVLLPDRTVRSQKQRVLFVKIGSNDEQELRKCSRC